MAGQREERQALGFLLREGWLPGGRTKLRARNQNCGTGKRNIRYTPNAGNGVGIHR